MREESMFSYTSPLSCNRSLRNLNTRRRTFLSARVVCGIRKLVLLRAHTHKVFRGWMSWLSYTTYISCLLSSFMAKFLVRRPTLLSKDCRAANDSTINGEVHIYLNYRSLISCCCCCCYLLLLLFDTCVYAASVSSLLIEVGQRFFFFFENRIMNLVFDNMKGAFFPPLLSL